MFHLGDSANNDCLIGIWRLSSVVVLCYPFCLCQMTDKMINWPAVNQRKGVIKRLYLTLFALSIDSWNKYK